MTKEAVQSEITDTMLQCQWEGCRKMFPRNPRNRNPHNPTRFCCSSCRAKDWQSKNLIRVTKGEAGK